MTILQFMDKFHLTNQKKVEEWLQKGLIPGAKLDNETNQWVISEHTYPPYTKARAKNADAIYVSIVNACLNQKSVCAKLYHLTEEQFSVYIKTLNAEGLITIQNIDGVDYYFATPQSKKYIDDKKGLQKHVKNFIRIASAATTNISTELLFEHVGDMLSGA